MGRISEWVLFKLSKHPTVLTSVVKPECNEGNALRILQNNIPDFIKLIKDKEVVDFGSGLGYQAIAMAKAGAKFVVGVDTNDDFIKKSNMLLNEFNKVNNVIFLKHLNATYYEKFNVVISQNSFEHFFDPENTLGVMKNLLRPGGLIIITFGPTWYSPYGAHMDYFTKLPWVQLIFNERTIMAVRSCFRSDGARKFNEVVGGLNQISVGKFENIVRRSGLKQVYKKYRCIYNFNFLARLPFIRELFVNQITVVLSKTPSGDGECQK